MSVELYKITVGPTVYRYTSGEFDVQTATELWEAHPIKRKDLTFEMTQNSMTLTVPDNLPPFDAYKANTPLIPINVEIISYPNNATRFVGVVAGIKYTPSSGTASVDINSTNNIKNVNCPKRTFGRECSYELYDSQCSVNKSLFKETIPNGQATFSAPNVIQHPNIANRASGSFTNGYIVLSTGESQYITEHTGDKLILLGGIYTYDTDVQIDVYMGCDKSYTTCEDRFSNIANFGGFPFIPSSNPVTSPF